MFNTQLLVDGLVENRPVALELPDGSAAVLTLSEAALYAFSAVCPHASGDFREGEIHRGRVYCPVHHWKFDLKSGRCVGDENYRIKKYAVVVQDGQVFLDI